MAGSSRRDKRQECVIIGDDRPLTVENKILAREVILEKTSDGKKNMRIILKPRTLGGGQGYSSSGDQSAAQPRPVKPVLAAGQTALVVSPGHSSRSVRKWVQGRLISQRCRASLKSEAYLWPIVEQVLKGRSKRSAPKKDTVVTSAPKRAFIS